MPFSKHHANTSVSITTGIGKISLNLNINWFMKMAEEEGWVMIDDHQDILDHNLTFGTNYHGDNFHDHDFWVLCENDISKILEEGVIELHGEYAAECLEYGVFQELMDDLRFKDEFNKHFISKEYFDFIEEFTDQMSELNTGDQLETQLRGGWEKVHIEKLHDGRWGVRTLEEKAAIREHTGDWFVNQRVVLIADYPHVEAGL